MKTLMKPTLTTMALLATLFPSVAAAQTRNFCSGNTECVDDTLSLVFRRNDASTVLLDEFSPGERFRLQVMAGVQSTTVSGWSFAVAHPSRFMTLLEDQVTTEGTIANPSHPDTVVIPPGLDVTRAVEGGFVSAVVLSFLNSSAVLPTGRHAICNAAYTLDVSPGESGARVRFVDEQIGAAGSPPTRIRFTVQGGQSRKPRTLTDATISVKPDEPTTCDRWALHFGAEATEDAFDPGEEPAVPISARNFTNMLSFQLGVGVTQEEDDGPFTYTFSEELGSGESRLVNLVCTDANEIARRPEARNTATAPVAPVSVVRGAAIEGFADNDFFVVNMSPAVGEGFTVGYLPDIEADPDKFIPATPDEGDCPVNELLVIRLDGQPASATFLRGDVDQSGALDLTDAVSGLGFLFLGDDEPACLEAADADSDGLVQLNDMVFVLAHLFQGGDAPAAPFPECDTAPFEDCATSTPACLE